MNAWHTQARIDTDSGSGKMRGKECDDSERSGIRTRQSCGFFAPRFNGRECAGTTGRKAKEARRLRSVITLPPASWRCVMTAPRGLSRLTQEHVMTTTDLVPVFTGTLAGQSTPLCNARDLHAALGVGRDFATWIKERIAEYGFVAGEDFIFGSPKRGNQTGRGGDRRSRDYHLTLDMAKELAMIENNEIGRSIRRYLIALEKKQQSAPVALPAPDPITPNLRDRIAKKAHALSLEQYDTLQDLLEELVVSNLRCGATETDCEDYLNRFGSHMGGVTLVNTHDLYQLSRTTTNLLDEAGKALAVIHRLEKHTGMELYHRHGVSGLPDSLCKTVFEALKDR